jgi:hypothetical protein
MVSHDLLLAQPFRFAALSNSSRAQVDGLSPPALRIAWQTRKPGKSGQKRPTAAMMAGIAGHVWSFDELFDEVLGR